MIRALVLCLDGPLMSFGDQAIDEIRPTRRLPGRSMLAGLLGNALGLDHRNVDALQRLQDRLRFAAREDRGGTLLRDYQTAEIGKKDPLWTSRGCPAGRDGGDATYSGPVLRERFYRADTAVTVALALDPADEPPDLDALAAALRRPERPLFLGRKGCPPARPILDALVEVPSLVEALGTAESEGPVETEPDDAPSAERVIDVPDRRDWRQGFHTGLSRRAQLRARPR
jgi:CRISPR system Cascade subunit CasD